MSPTATTFSTASPAGPTLDIAGLETVYDQLAEAIDTAGPAKSELFLVKLALLNAKVMGDAEQFGRQIEAALKDL